MGNIHSCSRTSRKQLIHSAYTSAALSILFMVVYGGCSWITAQRSDVGTLFFEWERYIPFIPILIIPYMSIDLFFVAAPFFIKSREDRSLFSKRITCAIIIAGICFLLFPLRYAFPRQTPEGWLAPIFNLLHGFDRPFNLLPSLHITLRTILADTYTRLTKGPLRWTLHIWFSLIGFSTLFTLQHHVLDVVGGFVLAGFCFYFFRNQITYPVTINRKVGSYYLLGSTALIGLTLLTWAWGSLFLWPAVSLLFVGLAYFGLVHHVYRKEFGRLPLSVKFLLAPCLFGQHLSLLYYKKHAPPWNEIVPGVLIGRKLSDAESIKAMHEGVTAFLDITAEFSEVEPFLKDSNYLNMPVQDLTAPTQDQLQRASDFILQEKAGGTVYVHCKIGYSRSAAVVGAYLIASKTVSSADESIGLMKKARPSLIIRPEVTEALREFERSNYVVNIDN